MKTAPIALALLICAALPAAMAADDPCSRFKWDVSREVALFREAPTAIVAGNAAASAPRIEAQQLYEARLHPQEGFSFATAPGKKTLDDGAHAGLFRLRVTEAGQYRIALGTGFWIEIVSGDTALQSLDFNGSPACDGPRKVVVYDLPAGTDLLLQFSAADSAQARFTVTQVAAAAQ